MYKWFLFLLIFSFTGCIKEKPLTPHERMIESDIELMKYMPELHFRFKDLIDKYRFDESKTKDILRIGWYWRDCLGKDSPVSDSFFSDKQNRGGFLGLTLPKNCEEIKSKYDEIKWDENGKAYIITKGKTVYINECGGYPFPEGTDDIKPDSYYIDGLTAINIRAIKCHKKANKDLDELNLD